MRHYRITREIIEMSNLVFFMHFCFLSLHCLTLCISFWIAGCYTPTLHISTWKLCFQTIQIWHGVSGGNSGMKLAGGCLCNHFLHDFNVHVAGSLPLPPRGKPFASWVGEVGSHSYSQLQQLERPTHRRTCHMEIIARHLCHCVKYFAR